MRAFFAFVVFAILLFFLALPVRCEEILLDVLPKFVTVNPYRRVSFRILIRIPEDPDNRLYSFGGDCGSEAVSWTREIDFRANTSYVELTVKADCVFQACVHRVVKGKAKSFCSTRIVEARGGS